jgi:hypothetical protein
LWERVNWLPEKSKYGEVVVNAIKAEPASGQSSRIIKAGNIAVLDPHAAKPAPVHTAEIKKGARVRLIKDGDIVKTIEVQCACGEVIRLDCEY